MTASGPTVVLGGAELTLLPDGAVWWSATGALFVADVHAGKEQTFHRFGIPIPSGGLASDLARLVACVQAVGAAQVVVLGDLVHHREGLVPDVRRDVAAAMAASGARWRLVRGNHDDHAPRLPPEWPVEDLGRSHRMEGLHLVHAPEDAVGPALCGHVHPVVRAAGVGVAGGLRCFHLRGETLILPAFSAFSGGATVRPARGDGVWAIVDDCVVALDVAALSGSAPWRARGGRA